MNGQEHVRDQLRYLVAKYGRQLVKENKRLRAMLLDTCGAHKSEVRLLLLMVEEGMIQALMQDLGSISAAIVLPRMVERLHTEFAIDRNLAGWAVSTWSEVLEMSEASWVLLMNEQEYVRAQLRYLVAKYGRQLAKENKRLREMLLDTCGAQKREVRLLLLMVEEGMIQTLMRDLGSISTAIILPRMVERLHTEFAIDRELAGWAVSAWSEVLEKQDSVFRDKLRDGSNGPEMVFICGGSFRMGSPTSEEGRKYDESQVQVSVGDFWIGKHEVTFEEYDYFAHATSHKLPNDQGWGRGNRPVINVSWNNATAYAEWLSRQTGHRYRLPTEVEWEYAARAGTTTARYWGEEIGHNHANCDGCGSQWDKQKTAPVGSFAPNAWGLYDMMGNVWEWTCSQYNKIYNGTEFICAAQNAGVHRVLRGGSWLYRPTWVRSAYRQHATPDFRGSDLGFRLAKLP